MENDWLSRPLSLAGQKIWVAGHRGMVGSALVRRLAREGCEILAAGREALDLRRADDVDAWVKTHRPDMVVLAAAKVGGIMANAKNPVDFLYDNIMIEMNVMRAAFNAGVKKFLFLGSSCIYPKHAVQPVVEEALLMGALEPTNEAYALAKIAGVKMGQAYRAQYGRDFISAMPCNLYGPGDNFDADTSHVIPALIRKAHDAKMSRAQVMAVWGSGRPLREFMHVDDAADAMVFLLKNYSGTRPVNMGAGRDMAIADLARMIAGVVGFEGHVVFDPSKPDGTPRKLMDSSRLYGTGWRPSVDLERGIAATYEWYLESLGMRAAA